MNVKKNIRINMIQEEIYSIQQIWPGHIRLILHRTISTKIIMNSICQYFESELLSFKIEIANWSIAVVLNNNSVELK